MLSRVAENLYWLGRYLERAENVARMANADFTASLEGDPGHTAEAVWRGLLIATDSEEAFEQARAEDPLLSPADFLITANANANSIRSTLERARGLARGLREHISREVWEEINSLHLALVPLHRVIEQDLHDVCGEIRRRVQTVLGLYDNAALRDEGREWFRTGLFIERADMTTRILDAKYNILLPEPSLVGGPLDHFQWMAILRSASAWEAYRKDAPSAVTARGVIELLTFNRRFPRSLVFCLMAARRHFEQATGDAPPRGRVQALKLMMELELELAALDVDAIIASGLHEFLDSFQLQLIALHAAITDDVFHAVPAAQRAAAFDQ